MIIMMTIEEMKARKEELMYTCAMISEKSGLPLSTVQKVFSGATAKPRYSTMEALDRVLKKPSYHYEDDPVTGGTLLVEEEALEFTPTSGIIKAGAKKVDCWTGEEPSERWPMQGKYTVDDYLAIPDDIRVELIDGVIYDMGAPRNVHQLVLSRLFIEFNKCIEEHDSPCMLFIAPLDVRLDGDNKTMVQPDLMIACLKDMDENEYTEMDRGKRHNGPPDLTVEILSPSTRTKDCTIKLRKYMNAGVKEYWIVDIDNEKVMVYEFEKDVLPTQYSFDDIIPIGLSEGKCSIDFSKVKDRLEKARVRFPGWFEP